MVERRIQAGQQLQLMVLSSLGTAIRAQAGVVRDDGVYEVLTISSVNSVGNLGVDTYLSSQGAGGNGYISWANVQLGDNTVVKPGQVWVALAISAGGANNGPVLCQGYLSNLVSVELGTFKDPGPQGGTGYLRLVTVKASSAPAATTTFTLAAQNTIRRVHGFAWFYDASAAAANRALAVAYNSPLLGAALPGTWSDATKADTWRSQAITLTASEEGILNAGPGRSATNDNGTIAIDSQDTAPSPFPLLVSEESLATLIFTVGSGDSGDRDAIYALVEDWLVR